MENKIKSIKLCFENVEVIELTPDMFKYLVIRDITENKIVNCYQYENGEEETYKYCKYFHIEINEKGLEKETWEGDLRQKLWFQDLVSVILCYEDKKEEEIFVNWNEDDDYTNKYQESENLENGSVEIIIERKKKEKFWEE